MQHTRRQIIEHLNRVGATSPIELSSSLQLTPANIRHHLSILMSQGLIYVSHYRKHGGRGRPTALFATTQSQSSSIIDEVLNAILTQINSSTYSTFTIDDLFEKIAEELIGEDNQSGSLIQRLSYAIGWLNKQNYQATWIASHEGPLVTFSNCPYQKIREKNLCICKLDQSLLIKLTGRKTHLKRNLVENTIGNTFCEFILT